MPVIVLTIAWAGFLAAADSTPQLDAVAIVQRSLEHESFDMDPPLLPDYTYTIEDEEKKLNADGSVKSTSSETREVMNLYGGHFERLVRKNGQDLPPDKARAEQARFDKAVEKRKRELEQWQSRQTPEEQSPARGGRQKGASQKAEV